LRKIRTVALSRKIRTVALYRKIRKMGASET